MNYNIGKIINTHGIKGEVVVKSLTDFKRFANGKKVYLNISNKKIILTIKNVRNTKKGLIVLFEEHQNINEVLKYKNLTIFTDEKPELKLDEFHYEDLINKEVYNSDNKFIGKVIEVIPVPQGELLRIEIADYTKLIPFNKHFIKEVNEKIIINEIEGLL